MLFNSIGFLFFFLPLTVVVYYLLSNFLSGKWLLLFLSAASLLFYAIGSRRSVPILLASIAINYILANYIAKYRDTSTAKWLVRAGVCANLGCLAWFKYTHFVVENLNPLLGTHFELASMFLPLGISFYTFKQIAYLVDVSHGDTQPGSVIDHIFTVVFFPQLIAGPITLHRDLARQLLPERVGRFAASNLVIGTSIFAIGLFKRTVLADMASPHADLVFDKLATSTHIGFLDAWSAALSYTLQLYFDFSGYSDMAVGASRMFGFKLPINFYSPLKAISIIDFWRRWHITLQRIIGRYFFQPLLIPISRFAAERDFGRWPTFFTVTALPTLLTFVLLGIWHGAGWTFVMFGLMHGLYATINEGWRLLTRKRRKKAKGQVSKTGLICSNFVTIAAVAFAGVLFRSSNIGEAFKLWFSMLNVAGIDFTQASLPTIPSFLQSTLLMLIVEFGIVLLLPNTSQIFHKFASVLELEAWDTFNTSIVRFKWKPSIGWAMALGVLFTLGVVFMLRIQTKFIYFNF